MDAALSSNYLNPYSNVRRESQLTLQDKEKAPSYTAEQKAHVAGLAALQVLGLFIFGSAIGIVIGATCARTETTIALPGKTEIAFTGYVLIPVLAGIVFGMFAGAYFAYKAINDPKKYLEELVDEKINKKAIEIEKEKSPFKKIDLERELEKLHASRKDVSKAPFEIGSRLYDWGATKIAATLVRQ